MALEPSRSTLSSEKLRLPLPPSTAGLTVVMALDAYGHRCRHDCVDSDDIRGNPLGDADRINGARCYSPSHPGGA